MSKKLTALLVAILMAILALALGACGSTQNADSGDADTAAGDSAVTQIQHRYASQDEGRELLLNNEEYFAQFSQNDLDFRMQKKGATMEEFLKFAGEQVLDFTEEEKAVVDEYFDKMAKTVSENGYTLPPLEEIVLVKTTMAEESGAGGYTHGTQIYVSADLLAYYLENPEDPERVSLMNDFFWHETFHCLTRSNPDFRTDMYKLIHFTVVDKDYTLPPSVEEYHISNPDVEHHNSYATFRIDGKDIDCFTDFVTTKHFTKAGESFFDTGTTALVPVDGEDTYYTQDQAENFEEVFGGNTEYVIDPEECLADNFALAMVYGMDGPEGKGYTTPEIIEGIIAYLSK